MIARLKKEILGHKIIYLLLGITLVLGFFVRVYRIDELLGFYYDQGRDALTIWNIWHKWDIPFIGPTTGIAGIFRGPFYYYLIAPFYLLGRGSPLWPSVFLSFTTVLATLVAYYLGFKIQGRMTGLIAAVISAFSFNVIMAARWLSNPTPMLLLSLLLVWLMILVTEGKKYAWVGIAFILGLSLFHFGSSGEAFYVPALMIFAFWQRKNLPNKKILLISFLLFFITVLPLIAFDIKNNGLLSGNIRAFLFGGGGSFGIPPERQIIDKILFLYDVFTNKIFNGRYLRETLLLIIVSISFIFHLHKNIKNAGIKILLLLLGVGSLGIVLFQGNFGNIYDYYLTGYYLPFILLFSVGLGALSEKPIGKVFILYFVYYFLTVNYDVINYKFSDSVEGPISVAFKNQKQAIEWVYKDAGGKEFNADVYVPPVISYAYDYLFAWYGGEKFGYTPKKENIELLYTLYEQDPPYPDRLEAWLARQKGIGKVEETARFGGITIERRTRIKW